MATKSTFAPDYAFSKQGARRRTKDGAVIIDDKGRKLCRQCGKYLLLSRYTANSNSVDGRRNICQQCESAEYQRTKQDALAKPERIKEVRAAELATVTDAEKRAAGDSLNRRVVRMAGARDGWQLGVIAGKRAGCWLFLADVNTPITGAYIGNTYLVKVADPNTLAFTTRAWERQWWQDKQDFVNQMHAQVGVRGQ